MTPPAKEEQELRGILELLQKVYDYLKNSSKGSRYQQKNNNTQQQANCEVLLGEKLEWFISSFQHVRTFNKSPLFEKFYLQLIEQKEVLLKNDDDNSVRIMWCLRMFVRDEYFQELFIEQTEQLVELFNLKTWEYLQFKNDGLLLDHLSRIFQKLSCQKKYHRSLLKLKVHENMLRLLRASDVTILHCALVYLIALAE